MRTRSPNAPPAGARRGRGRLPSLVLAALAWSAAVLACSGETPASGAEPLRLVNAEVDAATLGESYRDDLQPVGGLRPYSFRLEGGTLPPGIALQGGRLIGTPTELGTFEFTIAVSDANLSSTFRTFTVEVREVPEPRLSLTPPDTEVRQGTTLRLRVEEARALRGARVRVTWDADRFALAPDSVRAGSGRLALLHDAEPGVLRLDLTALGETVEGTAELARFTLEPTEPSTLRLEWRAEAFYSGRHHFEEQTSGPAPSTEGDAESDGDDEEGAEANGDDVGGDDAPVDGEEEAP